MAEKGHQARIAIGDRYVSEVRIPPACSDAPGWVFRRAGGDGP